MQQKRVLVRMRKAEKVSENVRGERDWFSWEMQRRNIILQLSSLTPTTCICIVKKNSKREIEKEESERGDVCW